MRIMVSAEDQQSALIVLRNAGVRTGGAVVSYGVLTLRDQKEIGTALKLLAEAGIKAETNEP